MPTNSELFNLHPWSSPASNYCLTKSNAGTRSWLKSNYMLYINIGLKIATEWRVNIATIFTGCIRAKKVVEQCINDNSRRIDQIIIDLKRNHDLNNIRSATTQIYGVFITKSLSLSFLFYFYIFLNFFS